MSENRVAMRPVLWGLTLLTVLGCALWMLVPTEEAPDASEADAVGETVLAPGGELLQTFAYARCGHTVTRRVTAPAELTGKNLREVEALYPEWKVTAFSPASVAMEQTPPLFCPDHLVVMTGSDGRVCVFENKYGDALALVRETDMTADQLPHAVQEELEMGVGFSTPEEMEMWLESVES